jgi:hypothetical protein
MPCDARTAAFRCCRRLVGDALPSALMLGGHHVQRPRGLRLVGQARSGTGRVDEEQSDLVRLCNVGLSFSKGTILAEAIMNVVCGHHVLLRRLAGCSAPWGSDRLQVCRAQHVAAEACAAMAGGSAARYKATAYRQLQDGAAAALTKPRRV